MGLMESDGGVHTGGGGSKGNGKGIIGKWVLNPFCDGNSNRKKLCQIQTYVSLQLLVKMLSLLKLVLKNWEY